MRNEKMDNSISNIDIGLLDLTKAEFYLTEGGFAGIRYGERDCAQVTLKRALPTGFPSDYVSVYDDDNKEIGIIKTLSDLDEKNLTIVVNELNTRYYCPDILEIKSIKDKMGYLYMELSLQGTAGVVYPKTCAVKDVNRNIRMLGEKGLVIFDVDGNRYIVKDVMRLDKASFRRIEPYLF